MSQATTSYNILCDQIQNAVNKRIVDHIAFQNFRIQKKVPPADKICSEYLKKYRIIVNKSIQKIIAEFTKDFPEILSEPHELIPQKMTHCREPRFPYDPSFYNFIHSLSVATLHVATLSVATLFAQLFPKVD